MRTTLLLLVVLGLAFPLPAQHGESVTVEVVEIPVYVRRNNVPVTGLTRENFEVLVEGKPQPIDYFDVVDTGAVRVAEGPRGEVVRDDLRERRLFLLLFDLAFSRPVAVERARRAAMDLVNGSARGDVFAVAAFTRTDGVRFATPFTIDRASVLAAVEAIRGRTAEHPMRTLVSEGASGPALAEAAAGQAAESGGAGGRGGGVEAEIEQARAEAEAQTADLRSRPIQRQHELMLEEFRYTARRLAQLDGQKHVVLFSEGPSIGVRNSHMLRLVEDLHRTFRASNAFLHAVDITGLRHTFRLAENESLHMLSGGTGGMVLQNSNDLPALVTEMREVHRYAYVLGFRPREARRGHNEVTVTLRGVENATLSHRRGFSTEAPRRQLDGLGLADIVLNDIPQTGIRPEVTASATGIRIVIPAAASAAAREVDVHFFVFDERKQIVESRRITLPVAGKARTIDAKLPLREGRYVARVLLRAGESIGVDSAAFAVR